MSSTIKDAVPVRSAGFSTAVTDGTRAGLLRRWLLRLAIGAALVGAGLYGWSWWSVGRFFETTDDAYVAADAVTLAPRVAGYLLAVPVRDNQVVRAGDVLARIDDRDYRAALAQAQAEVAEGRASLLAVDSQAAEQRQSIAQAQADLDGDEAKLRFAAVERDRAATLSATGVGSREAQQRTGAAFDEAEADLRHALAALGVARAKVQTLEAEGAYAAGSLAKARADVDRARINLDDTVLRAPVDGVVGDGRARAGNYVQPGLGLLTVVPMGQGLYVTANFKETQLARMQPGEAVTVTADAFPGHPFRGVIDGFSPGTGAQFALLPPENATGNFTKIVQRVPVRIRLAPDRALRLLRAGLSVEVSVDTRGAAGPARPG